MKIHDDKKCLDALGRWRSAEMEYAKQTASGLVVCEISDAPDMTPIEQIVFFHLRESGIEVFPQEKIGKYRVDFLIRGDSVQTVIECDGHDFHERTKEQAQKDKERDRTLQAAGFRVFRFTGSEIWKTDGKCVTDSLDVTNL